MACPECARLSTDFEQLGKAYNVAIQKLTARASTSSRTEYGKLRIAVEDARLNWRSAEWNSRSTKKITRPKSDRRHQIGETRVFPVQDIPAGFPLASVR
jgi:hypothetical protein